MYIKKAVQIANSLLHELHFALSSYIFAFGYWCTFCFIQICKGWGGTVASVSDLLSVSREFQPHQRLPLFRKARNFALIT